MSSLIDSATRGEIRSFNQRFGERCFCGEAWGSRKACGPPDPSNLTIEEMLTKMFRPRADRIRTCPSCQTDYTGGRMYCDPCADSIRADRKRPGNRHTFNAGTCQQCGTAFESRSKVAKYCSLSCGNRARQARKRNEVSQAQAA